MYIKANIVNTIIGDIMINISEVISVTIRAFLSLVTLFLVTKMLGKKQVSQLSLFDYVIGISIGNFAAEMTINLETSEVNGILAVVLFGVFAYTISYLTTKSICLRRFFQGTPTIIVEKGKILENNMRKIKLDINDLLEELRSKGYFSLNEVEYVIMEVSGDVSILPKAKYKPLTLNDMNTTVEDSYLECIAIIDGKIMKNNLKDIHKNEYWLKKEIRKQKNIDISKILLCTIDNNMKINVYERNLNIESKDILE